jgi:hypothetical protein
MILLILHLPVEQKPLKRGKERRLFPDGWVVLVRQFLACLIYRFDLPNLLLRYSFNVVIIVDIVLTETFLQKDSSFVEETQG